MSLRNLHQIILHHKEFMINVDQTVAHLESVQKRRESDWDSSYILVELRKKGVLTDAQYASFVKWDVSSTVKKKTLLRWKYNHLRKDQ